MSTGAMIGLTEGVGRGVGMHTNVRAPEIWLGSANQASLIFSHALIQMSTSKTPFPYFLE